MAVEGFPDTSIHRLCRRCRKWFDADAGEEVSRDMLGPVTASGGAAVRLAGLTPTEFLCNRCLRTVRTWKIAFLCLLVIMIGTAFVLDWLEES